MPVPESTWVSILEHCDDKDELARVGESAAKRLILPIAERCLDKAVKGGRTDYLQRLVTLLRRRGDETAERYLREAMAAGVEGATWELELLLSLELPESLWRNRFTANQSDPSLTLRRQTEELARKQRVKEDRAREAMHILRSAVERGEPDARSHLAGRLGITISHKEFSISFDMDRAGILTDARRWLDPYRLPLGRPRRTRKLLMQAVQAGEPGALRLHAEVLEWSHKWRQAEHELRTAAAGADGKALCDLAITLQRWGRGRDAELTWRAAIEAIYAAAPSQDGASSRSQRSPRDREPGRDKAWPAGRRIITEYVPFEPWTGLATLYEQWGDHAAADEAWTSAVQANERTARRWQVRLSTLRSARAEQEALLRAAATDGEQLAYVRLARHLQESARIEEATEWWRRAARHNSYSLFRYAESVEQTGSAADIVAAWYACAKDGASTGGWRQIKRVLIEQGDHGRAESVLLDGTAKGHEWARLELADMLLAQRRAGEAVRLLSQGADAGQQYAATRLAELLEARQEANAAEQVLRQAVRRPNFHQGLQALTHFLERHGRLREAEELLWAMQRPGDTAACAQLVGWLERHNRAGEAEPLLRRRVVAGEGEFYNWLGIGVEDQLIRHLTAIGRGDEARSLRRHGLRPDGTLATPR